jgi:iron(III) transport system permease protein
VLGSDSGRITAVKFPGLRGQTVLANHGLWLMAALLATLGYYIVYPLLLLLINSFNTATIADPPLYGLGVWTQVLADGEMWIAMWNTVSIALVLQAISFPIGILIAWVLARTDIPFRNGFEFLFWISFLMPPISVTFAWILLLNPNTGLVNTWLQQLPLVGASPFNVYSYWGIIWVHLMAHGISGKIMFLTPAFRRMDSTLEEASQVSGASTMGTMLRIHVPIMTPIIVVVLLLSLIRMFSSLEIELILGVPWGFYVYSTMIMDLARQEPPLVNQAAALGCIILAFLVPLILLQRRLIGAREYTTVTGKFQTKLIQLGIWRIPATIFVAFVAFVLVIFPAASLLGGSFMVRFGYFNLATTWTLDYWKQALSNPGLLTAFSNTIIIAGTAGFVGPLIFSWVAYLIVRTKIPGRMALDFICWLPSAIPGVLSGLGLLWMFLGTPMFRPLYGTLALLVLASVLGGVTISTQLLKANLVQLGRDLEEASFVSGAGFWRTYFNILLPLTAQAMVLIGVLKFIFAAQNVSNIILLATSESRTLSLLALDQIGEGLREAASVTIIIVILMTLGLALAARFLGLRVGIQQ